MKKIMMGLAVFAALAQMASAQTYEIDTKHSSVGFRVKHIVSKVPGHFSAFNGVIQYDGKNSKNWSVKATIDPASINTDVEARDKHLKSADFFDVDRCKEMIFQSTSISDVKDGKGKLAGNLTMHCVTKPVVLDLEINGSDEDPWGNTALGFTATGKINRYDWDLKWNKTLKAGNLLVGDIVEITLDIAANPKKEETKPVAPAKEQKAASPKKT